MLRLFAILLALAPLVAHAQFDDLPAVQLKQLSTFGPPTTIRPPARAHTLCGTTGRSLPVDIGWAIDAPLDGNFALEVLHQGVGRIVVTDVSAMQVLERTDHAFRGVGSASDVDQALSTLFRTSSTAGNFDVAIRVCSASNPRCAEAREYFVVEQDGDSIETTTCAAPPVLRAGQDSGARNDDDWTSVTPLTFDVASTAGTQSWYRETRVGTTFGAPVLLGTSTLATAGTATRTLDLGVGLHRITVEHPGGRRSAGRFVQVFDPTPGTPTSIEILTTPQTRDVGTSFDPFRLRVLDEDGQAVPNVPVTFVARDSQGDTIASATFAGASTYTATSGADGIAQSIAATANARVGNHTIGVRVQQTDFATGFPVRNDAGPAAVIEKLLGDPQTANVNDIFPSPMRVRAKDAFGNVVRTTVTFEAPAAGPSAAFRLTPSGSFERTQSFLLDTQGEGRVEAIANGTVGSYLVTVRADAAETTFALHNRSGSPAAIATLSANPQSGATPGAPAPAKPRVRVTDAGGNPVRSGLVTFAIGAGGGSVAGEVVPTDANGVAEVGDWILGPGFLTENRMTAASGIVATTFFATTRDGPFANLGIEVGDGKGVVAPGARSTYSVTITNEGPDAVSAKLVANADGLDLAGATWTCAASAGSSCGAANGAGSLDQRTMTIAANGRVDFAWSATTTAAVGSSATLTVGVAPTAGTDPTPANDLDADVNGVADVVYTNGFE